MPGSLGATVLVAQLLVASQSSSTQLAPRTGTRPVERQITTARCGHILTNTGIWSPDGTWLVYDTRSTPAGDKFVGSTIEIVNVRTDESRVLYRAQRGARCGVAYEDHVLAQFNQETSEHEINLRNVGVSAQGQVLTRHGETISEVYVVDLPEDLTQAGDGPLAGTETHRPFPPKGTRQRRLTFTADRKYPGLQGPCHWLRSSPDGSRIAFLMKDDDGTVQLWIVSPCGGPAAQLTHNRHSIDSAFSWSSDGKFIAHVMDGSVCVTDAHSGQTKRLTKRAEAALAPRPEACVFSPDARQIAYVRPVRMGERVFNQIFVVTFAH